MECDKEVKEEGKDERERFVEGYQQSFAPSPLEFPSSTQCTSACGLWARAKGLSAAFGGSTDSLVTNEGKD